MSRYVDTLAPPESPFDDDPYEDPAPEDPFDYPPDEEPVTGDDDEGEYLVNTDGGRR